MAWGREEYLSCEGQLYHWLDVVEQGRAEISACTPTQSYYQRHDYHNQGLGAR
jgi:hypothetical protein